MARKPGDPSQSSHTPDLVMREITAPQRYLKSGQLESICQIHLFIQLSIFVQCQLCAFTIYILQVLRIK